MDGPSHLLERNLDRIRGRIDTAAARAGRSPSEITLLAVTKYVGREEIEALLDLGVTALGENRVQAAREKILRREGISWHMIGHLQRNKARRAVEIFDVVESVDSFRLAVKLNEEAARFGKRLPVYLEVNISGEAAKTGLPLEEVPGLCKEIPTLDALEVHGVMGMAPFSDDPESSRPYFRKAREIRDRIRQVTGLAVPGLSIGMTRDFETAIEEGATVVRIGQALYEGII